MEDVEYSDELLTFALDNLDRSGLDDIPRRALSKSELIATEALTNLMDSLNSSSSHVGGTSSSTVDVDEKNALKSVDSSDSWSLNSNSEVIHEAQPVKKKRYAPSMSNYVSKKDIRHTYAKAYIDACNSGSVHTYARMIREIATPDVRLVSAVVTPTDAFLPKSLEAVGRETLIAAFEAFVKSMPDCCFELLSSKFKVFRNGESAIICKFTMKGTKVFQIHGLPEGTDDSVVLTRVDDTESSSGDFDQMHVNAEITSKVVEPNQKKPVSVSTNVKLELGEMHTAKAPVSVIGTNTLYVNADKKVFRIERVTCNNV